MKGGGTALTPKQREVLSVMTGAVDGCIRHWRAEHIARMSHLGDTGRSVARTLTRLWCMGLVDADRGHHGDSAWWIITDAGRAALRWW